MDLDDHLLDRFSRLPTSGPFTHAVVPASYSMISHAPLLQRLHDLDKTSPQFHQRLSDFLRGDDYRSLLSGLQNEDLVSLVEYLAGVLASISDHRNTTFQDCLHELRKICGTKKVMPRSCMLSDSLLVVGLPTASGRVYDGTFGCSKVHIRRIKLYPGGDPQHLEETFHQTAVVWKHLTHRNVVPLFGVTINPLLQLVSAGTSEEDLTGYITNHPDANPLSLLCDVALGLNYLHFCNVIHGSLKGHNIHVDPTGCARITNIGVDMVAQNLAPIQSVPGGYHHNVNWAAPEILEITGTYSKEVDVFSFAGVMIEVFTGAAPFSSSSPYAAMLAIISGDRPPRPTNPVLTEGLWKLMQRCWVRESHLRPRALEILRSFDIPAWKRLISRPLSTDENISLVTALLSDSSETGAVEHLRGDDAQTFVDVIDKISDALAPSLQRKCLGVLRKICGRQASLPGSLRIPICYDRSSTPMYRGGCADVWKGKYRDLQVAVKVLRVYSTSDFEKIKSRFCKEAVAWRTLQHPNVLPLLGVTITNFRMAMISEWMTNGNINEFLKTNRDVNRFKLLGDVARGLLYLHDRGMLHGDLKGANILIDQSGHARLADFGLLTTISDPTGFTPSSSTTGAGTTRWMSPELLHPEEFGFKDSKPTKGSDCYALGMVILEVLSGHVPFAYERDVVVMRKVIEGERPERPKTVWFTDDLWKAMEQCWSPQPSDRPAVEAVLQLLERISRVWQPLHPSANEDSQIGPSGSRPTPSYYSTGTVHQHGNQLTALYQKSPAGVPDQVTMRREALPRLTHKRGEGSSRGANLFPITAPIAELPLDYANDLRRRGTIPQPSLAGSDRTAPPSSDSETVRPIEFYLLNNVSSFHGDPHNGAGIQLNIDQGSFEPFPGNGRPLGQLSVPPEPIIVRQEPPLNHDLANHLRVPTNPVMDHSPTSGASNPGQRRRHTTIRRSFSPVARVLVQPRPISWPVQRAVDFSPPIRPRNPTALNQTFGPSNSREGLEVRVPQRLYIPGDLQDNFFHHSPITFVDSSGRDGIVLADGLNGNFTNLVGGGDPALASYAETDIDLGLEWPGYQPWSTNIRIKDRRDALKPITNAELAAEVARGVQNFIVDNANKPVMAGTERWKVGPGFLEVKRLVLVRLEQVAKHSWQPELRVIE